MISKKNKTTQLVATAIFSAAFLSACGGGSDGAAPTPAPAPNITPSTPAPPAPITSPVPEPIPVPEPVTPAPPSDGSDNPEQPVTEPSNPPAPEVFSDRIESLDTLVAPRQSLAFNSDAKSKLEAKATAGLASPEVIKLAPLDSGVESGFMKKSARAIAGGDKSRPVELALGRDVAAGADFANFAKLLKWQLIGNKLLASIELVSPNASSLRAGLLVSNLPAGFVIRSYSPDDLSDVSVLTADDIQKLIAGNLESGLSDDEARRVWTATANGERLVLEFEMPASADVGSLKIAIPALSHFVYSLEQTAEPNFYKNNLHIGDAGSCNLDVSCSNEGTLARSVAKMIYTNLRGESYLCTGTLLNDAANSRTPYFLTANHCISNSYEASTLETYWFFQTAACGTSRLDSRSTRVTGGSRLLYTHSTLDASLLRLNSNPPSGVVFAGSYFGGSPARTGWVLGIHHPMGDLKKYSTGSVDGFYNCSPTAAGSECYPSVQTNSNHMGVTWQSGVTQQGSSGSPLFAQIGNSKYTVGVLSAGSSSCDKPNESDIYARFDRAWNGGIGSILKP